MHNPYKSKWVTQKLVSPYPGLTSLIPRPLPACQLFSGLTSLNPRPLPAWQPCSQASPASFPDHCQHVSLVLRPPQPQSQTTASLVLRPPQPHSQTTASLVLKPPQPHSQTRTTASMPALFSGSPASFPDHCQHVSLVLRPPQPHSQTTASLVLKPPQPHSQTRTTASMPALFSGSPASFPDHQLIQTSKCFLLLLSVLIIHLTILQPCMSLALFQGSPTLKQNVNRTSLGTVCDKFTEADLGMSFQWPGNEDRLPVLTSVLDVSYPPHCTSCFL